MRWTIRWYKMVPDDTYRRSGQFVTSSRVLKKDMKEGHFLYDDNDDIANIILGIEKPLIVLISNCNASHSKRQNSTAENACDWDRIWITRHNHTECNVFKKNEDYLFSSCKTSGSFDRKMRLYKTVLLHFCCKLNICQSFYTCI